MKFDHFVLPKTYLVGFTAVNMPGMLEYLADTNQETFMVDIEDARKSGLNDGEILCSFYAKLCYASLTTEKNLNISKVRSIEDNVHSIVDNAHGAVVEHCWINFVTTKCSRIYTHELVRHRVGTAFSQTSGRYVRSDKLDLVIDPILEPAYDLIEEGRAYLENLYGRVSERMKINDVKDFSIKKKITSAMRRIMPNGQANEIGFSVNLRTLRHTIEQRTSPHAEWEIRVIFNQVYDLIKAKYPAIFFDVDDGLVVDGQRVVKFKHSKI